jgi:beta-galactosidase
MKTKRFFVLPFLFACLLGFSQDRNATTVNSNWQFFQGEDSAKMGNQNKWTSISIPHTWNANDVMDEQSGYYRGVGWYKKTIYLPKAWSQKEVYLYFEGVGQVAEVFINGKSVGKHIGSYNAFSFDISPYLNFSVDNTLNELVVRVDNSHNENIPPLAADFTFYGGIYRDVNLIAVNKVHFDCDNYASTGIFIQTPLVNETKAVLNIKGAFVNGSNAKRNILISQQIFDAEGNLYAEQKKVYNANAGQKLEFEQEWNNLKGMHLWSIEDPYLYRVVSTISDAGTKEKLDQISNPLGFRWYQFDANKGFSLNGKPIKLIGASRHQDFKGLGNALSDDMHVQDVLLLKQMGGNFLRIAHYPQDPTILEVCDRLGILTSVETPIVNRITETEEFSKNAKQMHLEMIRQNYNHPSLIMWTYMNEVLLMPRFNKGSEQQEKYFTAVAKLARALEDITHGEDSIRYTMIPNHGAWDLYNKVGLTKIPKLVGWNLYQGWYSGTLEDFGKFLDKHHAELPDKPLLITEYGSDADIRLHSFKPERFDKTVEYTTLFHQAYLKDMLSRPFVAAAMIWNLAEFNSEQRAETTPHINAKGLLTFDRKPKDSYRFYQANLLKTPYLQIGSKEWDKRTGFAISAKNLSSVQPVTVFSNQQKVTISLNGKEIGTVATAQGMAKMDIPFVNGVNELTASSNENGVQVLDHVTIQFQLLSQDLKNAKLPFQSMNISLGDKRYFFDAVAGQTWIPEQEYQPGSWGYIGGQIFTMKGSTRTGYGTTKHSIGSDLDPIFQTQRTGIQQFKMDLPNGTYDLSLLFAELLSPTKANELVYNLGNAAPPEEFKERSFNVLINGQEILSGFGNNNYLEPLHAITTKHRILVSNNEGITIDFKALVGDAVLNGIQVRKVY